MKKGRLLRFSQSGFFGTALLVLIIVGIVLAVFVTLIRQRSPSNEAPLVAAPAVSESSLKGLSFSPKSYGAEGINDFFAKAKQINGAVTWAGDWQDLGKSSGGPNLVFTQAKKNNLTPIAIATTHRDIGQGKVTAIRPLTATQIQSYSQLAQDFASANKPAYLGLGIEVNRIFENSPADYQLFVELFNKTVTAVHSVSPDTKVFTTFQLERLRGLRGGLYGGKNDASINDWGLLDDFSSADTLGFTSYPGLIYHSPSEIPDDYYQIVAQHTSKPVIFSELGWQAQTVAAGWESSPAMQEQFVKRFFSLTESLNPRVNIWSFLYDPNTAVPFNSMGLYTSDGAARSAWQEFLGTRL